MNEPYLPPADAYLIATERRIAAPAANVWRVLTVFADYPAWNPYMISVIGDFTRGAILKVRTRDAASSKETDHVVRIASVGRYEMHWVGGLPDHGEFRGDHFFALETTGSANTLFRHYEYFSGSAAASLLDRYASSIERNFQIFNLALEHAAAPTD